MNEAELEALMAKLDPAHDTPEMAELRTLDGRIKHLKAHRKAMIEAGIDPPEWVLVVGIFFGVMLMACVFATMIAHWGLREAWPVYLAMAVSLVVVMAMRIRYPNLGNSLMTHDRIARNNGTPTRFTVDEKGLISMFGVQKAKEMIAQAERENKKPELVPGRLMTVEQAKELEKPRNQFPLDGGWPTEEEFTFFGSPGSTLTPEQKAMVEKNRKQDPHDMGIVMETAPDGKASESLKDLTPVEKPEDIWFRKALNNDPLIHACALMFEHQRMPGVRIREFTREHLLFMLYKMAQQRDESRAILDRAMKSQKPLRGWPTVTAEETERRKAFPVVVLESISDALSTKFHVESENDSAWLGYLDCRIDAPLDGPRKMLKSEWKIRS